MLAHMCYNEVAKMNMGRFVFSGQPVYNYISRDMSKALLMCGLTSRPFILAMTGKHIRSALSWLHTSMRWLIREQMR